MTNARSLISRSDAPAEDAAAEAAVRAFTRLLRAHASATRMLSAELLENHGLTINDYEALLVLSHADGRRLKRVELSQRLLLTPSGITRLLEGLESVGLVEREQCASDLRVTYAHLTDVGAERLRAAGCAHVRSIRALFEDHLTASEIETVADILDRLPGVGGAEDACGSG